MTAINLGEYEFDPGCRLGGGAMGEVFLGRQLSIDRRVAVKVLHPQLVGNPVDRIRFERESDLLGRLSSPYLVQVFSRGDYQGRPYIALEYVDGKSLDQLLAVSGPRPIATALEIARQVASALGTAHEAGVIHRDVKPSNVLVGRDGRTRLSDLGIARWAQDVGLTLTGSYLGTPAYMSPEQAEARPAGPASDVYSLGVVLYEMLAGRLPFVGPTSAVLNAHSQRMPDPVRTLRSEVPDALDALVTRCLEKRPEDRPANLEQALRDLQQTEGPEMIRSWSAPLFDVVDRLEARAVGAAPRRAGAAGPEAETLVALEQHPPKPSTSRPAAPPQPEAVGRRWPRWQIPVALLVAIGCVSLGAWVKWGGESEAGPQPAGLRPTVARIDGLTRPQPLPKPTRNPAPPAEPPVEVVPPRPRANVPADGNAPFLGQRIRERNVVFVIDKSEAMGGVLDRLCNELRGCLAAMTPDHRFTILFFDTQIRAFSRKLVIPSRRYIKLANMFANMQRAAGAAKAEVPLSTAVRVPGAQAIVFVTAGSLSPREQDIVRKIIALREIKLYFVAIAQNRVTRALAELAKKQ